MTAADVPSVEVSQLFASLAQAKLEWAASGVSAEQMARLDTIHLAVADLPGLALGQTEDGVITIDANAAGWGWFVDRTPQDSREFALQGGVLVASSGPAAGHMDLLTVLTHELGHALGLQHADAGVMTGQLIAGVRETPPEAPYAQPAFDAAPSLAVPMLELAAPPLPIDWTVRPLVGIVPRGASKAATAVESISWQARFVNHLGTSPERVNPNVALRIHAPLANSLSRL